jgi:hypothetical protein
MPTQIMPSPGYGLFRCPFCSNDELVDADDSGHQHDDFCGDRVWADELPAFPIDLRWPLSDEEREQLEEAIGAPLQEEATLLDALVGFIDLRPEEGRAMLERFLSDDWWTTCPCCGRRGQLVAPLVPIAA